MRKNRENRRYRLGMFLLNPTQYRNLHQLFSTIHLNTNKRSVSRKSPKHASTSMMTPPIEGSPCAASICFHMSVKVMACLQNRKLLVANRRGKNLNYLVSFSCPCCQLSATIFEMRRGFVESLRNCWNKGVASSLAYKLNPHTLFVYKSKLYAEKLASESAGLRSKEIMVGGGCFTFFPVIRIN